VKILPTNDENILIVHPTNSNTDNEQLTREDLKYSVKIFLRSLDPQVLAHTIDTG